MLVGLRVLRCRFGQPTQWAGRPHVNVTVVWVVAPGWRAAQAADAERRVTALLEAAGPHHHGVAAYVTDHLDDATASLLASLGVAPLWGAARPARRGDRAVGPCRRMHAVTPASFGATLLVHQLPATSPLGGGACGARRPHGGLRLCVPGWVR
jgi:hypothetical protein